MEVCSHACLTIGCIGLISPRGARPGLLKSSALRRIEGAFVTESILRIGFHGPIGLRNQERMLNSITPFFIVDDLDATIRFYESQLGFELRYKGGGEGEIADYWAFLGRDRVMIMFKAIAPEVHPQPNRSRHEWARWDAYVNVDDPDGLYAEFVGRNVRFTQELTNNSDGLRAFEVIDNNGYVICFGRPVEK